MENYTQQQILFLNWFKHHRKRSLSQIRSACNNLLLSFDLETKSALFKVFYPLVRKGYVEFIGEGNYHISNSVILYYPTINIAVAVNLFENQVEKLAKGFDDVLNDDFSIYRFKAKKNEVVKFCDDINCHFEEVNTVKTLSNFPKIVDVISNFEKAHLNANGECYDLINHKWKESRNAKYGLFRVDNTSFNIYLKTDRFGDLRIPDNSINPDARPLTEVYQAGFENLKYVFYKRSEEELTINNINLPILIERILRTNVLCYSDGVFERKGQLVFNYTKLSVVKQINRILGIKAIIEE
jgi:hypothetical protein